MSTIPSPPALSAKLRYLRLARFDTSSEEGRAAERYRLAAFGALANVGARVTSMLLMVLTVHWAAPVLGVERFGVWATFASLAAMLSFLDLGVGNALINRVAHTVAMGDEKDLRNVVAGGIGWLAVISAAAATLLALVAVTVPWNALFKLSGSAAMDETREAALVFSGLFGAHMLSSGLLKILVGQQRSHEAHIISAAGALLACAALWWTLNERIGIAGLMLAAFGVQAMAGFAVVPLLWRRGVLELRNLAPAMRAERGTLLKTGSLFLVLQIGTMVGWGCDSLLLASLGGAAQVAAFAVAQRLFQFASQPVTVLNAPLWAAYADAHARADRAFVRRTLGRSFQLSVGIGASLAAGLLLVGPWVIPQWTQGTIDVPWSLLAVMAAWTVLEVGGTAFGTYLNGVGIVREQVVVVLAFCTLALPLKVFGVMQAGAPGLVTATLAVYLVVVAGLYSTVFRRKVLHPLGKPLG